MTIPNVGTPRRRGGRGRPVRPPSNTNPKLTVRKRGKAWELGKISSRALPN